MFITPAYAQTAAGSSTGDLLSTFVPIIAMFAIFYFLVIRPQQQRQKEHQESLKGLRRGDNIVLGAGILGKVVKVPNEGDEIVVELADNVRIKALRSAVTQILSRGEAAKADGEGA